MELFAATGESGKIVETAHITNDRRDDSLIGRQWWGQALQFKISQKPKAVTRDSCIRRSSCRLPNALSMATTLGKSSNYGTFTPAKRGLDFQPAEQRMFCQHYTACT